MDRILTFFINTNVIVSIAALCLYKVTEIIIGIRNPALSLFVFSATLFAYNYMRLPLFTHIKMNKRNTWLNQHQRIIYIVLFFASILIVYALSILGLRFLYLVMPAFFIGILYPITIKTSNAIYSIRGIPFFKIFLIALTWGYVTFLVPVIYNNLLIDYTILDFFLQRVLFVVAISIPFDIRDIEDDQIKTIPKVFGIYESKIFAWFCLLVIDLLLIIDFISGVITLPFFIAMFMSIELASLTLYFSNQHKSFIFYGFLVEGLSIIMCLFVLIASMI